MITAPVPRRPPSRMSDAVVYSGVANGELPGAPVMPASTGRMAPVTKAASSLARYERGGRDVVRETRPAHQGVGGHGGLGVAREVVGIAGGDVGRHRR